MGSSLICPDTNCWIAFLTGKPSREANLLAEYASRQAVGMAPIVLAELLSDPLLEPQDEEQLLKNPNVADPRWLLASRR